MQPDPFQSRFGRTTSTEEVLSDALTCDGYIIGDRKVGLPHRWSDEALERTATLPATRPEAPRSPTTHHKHGASLERRSGRKDGHMAGTAAIGDADLRDRASGIFQLNGAQR